LQKSYPEFFKNKVNFNAVLHKNNSVDEIYNYFKTEFSKQPSIAELNTSGIKVSKQAEFWSNYKNYFQSLKQSNNYEDLENEMFIETPFLRNQAVFIRKMNKACFNSYNDLIFDKNLQERTPTGTCLPFAKKIFITVNGKILSCEKIDHKFTLGHVDSDQIKINYNEVAEKYNNYYSKIQKLCQNCYGSDLCTQCIFNMNIESDELRCPGFTNLAKYIMKVTNIFSSFEEYPYNYKRMITEVNLVP